MKAIIGMGRVGFAGMLLALVAMTLPSSAQHLPSTGLALSVAPDLCTGGVSASPSSLNFGDMRVGKASGSKTAAAKNGQTCKEPFEIFVRIVGADPGDFSQTNNCPVVLQYPKGCLIQVVFAPKKTKARTASLEIEARGKTGTNSYTVKLSGIGTD